MVRSGDTPATKAFDKYLNTTVYKFSDACDDLEMGDMGKHLVQTFSGMKYVVVLASKSKQPEDMAELAQHLSPLTGPVGEIRKLRLNRDFDNHQKAIMEMLTCVTWVTCRAPAQLPAPFVKECIGSSDFWSNRIRKEFKGKDDDAAKKQLEFCETLKKTLQDLASYIEEYHKTGLEFNPKGVSVAEAAIRMSDNPLQDAAIEANRKKDKMANRKNESIGNTVKGGNMLGLVSELANRRSNDGSSAATGLRKVRIRKQELCRLFYYRTSFLIFPYSVLRRSQRISRHGEKSSKMKNRSRNLLSRLRSHRKSQSRRRKDFPS